MDSTIKKKKFTLSTLTSQKKKINFAEEKPTSHSEKKKITVNVRIIFDYVQMVSISQTLKIQWPIYFKNYFKTFSFIGFANKIISFDCIFEDFSINLETFYVKSLILAITPFFLFFLILLYCLVFARKKKFVITKLIVAIFVIFTFFQPSIISQLMEIVTCVEIDNHDYLSYNLQYECYKSEHNRWVNYKKLFIFLHCLI